jgi:hypothetical protein
VAGIPLLSSTASWDNWVKPVYAVSVGLALLVAAVCWLAGRSVKRERADSVSDIKGDLDKLLSGYERKPISQQALAEAIVPFLQRMRAEARENHRLISEVKQRAEYWRWTEAPTPETKEWKKNSSILEADTEHQELYEAGQRAARRVDGLMTTRSVRMLTRARKVKPGDGLDETLHALEEFERLLTAEVDRALG